MIIKTAQEVFEERLFEQYDLEIATSEENALNGYFLLGVFNMVSLGREKRHAWDKDYQIHHYDGNTSEWYTAVDAEKKLYLMPAYPALLLELAHTEALLEDMTRNHISLQLDVWNETLVRVKTQEERVLRDYGEYYRSIFFRWLDNKRAIGSDV